MLVELLHYQSSLTLGGRTCRDHRHRRERQWCAVPRFSIIYIEFSTRGTYADNTLRTDKLDQLVLNRARSIARAVSLEVAQVTNMAFLVRWSTVCLVEWVD